MTKFKMAATAILEEELLKLSNRSTDCHHIWQESSIGDIIFRQISRMKFFTESKMALRLWNHNQHHQYNTEFAHTIALELLINVDS